MNAFVTHHVCTVCGHLLTMADCGIVCNQCRRGGDRDEINQWKENEHNIERLRESRKANSNQVRNSGNCSGTVPPHESRAR